MNPLSATSWLSSLGTAGVFLVLFAETGLLIGFFLPGDSLLFTAGLFCTTSASATVHLSLPMVLIAAIAGALLGAQTGFVLGRRGGQALLARTENRHLHRGLNRGEELFTRYGHAKAIVIARFIPVVRTVLNPLAGILAVPTRTFTLWQIAGGLLWTVGFRSRATCSAPAFPAPTGGHVGSQAMPTTSATRRAYLILAVAAVAVFLLTLLSATGVLPWAAGLDLDVHRWLVTHRPPALASAARALTATASSAVTAPLVLVAALLLTEGGAPVRLRRAAIMAVTTLIAMLCRFGLSQWVGRSWPPVWSAAAVYTVLIAWTRVELGVH